MNNLIDRAERNAMSEIKVKISDDKLYDDLFADIFKEKQAADAYKPDEKYNALKDVLNMWVDQFKSLVNMQ